MSLKLRKESFFFFSLKLCCTSVEGVNDEGGCLFFAAWGGTGPVNLALWWVTMTRGFTGHKPRGMSECRKWATVSIFCQTALRLLLPFPSLCVYAYNCYSYDLILFCNSIFQVSWCCLSLKLFLPSSRSCFYHMQTILTGSNWNSALKVNSIVCGQCLEM